MISNTVLREECEVVDSQEEVIEEAVDDKWMMQKTHKMGGGFPTITPDSNELADEVVEVAQSAV